MNKKFAKILLLLIPFISILLIIVLRLTAEPTNEEIIERLRDKPCYSINTEYIIKNSRGEQREETVLYFSKDHGGRIDFGEDRVKFYNDKDIIVKDNISNREYFMDEDMDKLHSIAFMKNLLSLPIEAETLTEKQEEWGEIQYIEFISQLSMENNHLDKVKVFIDKKKQTPIGAIVYNKDGKESVRIIYKDFKEIKNAEDLF